LSPIKKLLQNIGPGPLVAAAFIGPGTVMVCTLAGFNFGFELLWALGLSVLITIVLQETSGRIGIATQKDLGELVRESTSPFIYKSIQILLIFSAIVLGNIAYESGNITGARLGLEVFISLPKVDVAGLALDLGNLFIGLLAFAMLWFAKYQSIERFLVFLVILMSISFIWTAIALAPDWTLVAGGFIPRLNSDNLTNVVAMIGTTVVPYNLFLYASLSKNKWKDQNAFHWMRWDIGLAVVLGGLVSMAILIVGTFNMSEQIQDAQSVANGLLPVFGKTGTYLMGFGLLAAGLTSSITAPLAAALVICGILGKNQETQSKPMRLSILLVMGLGLIFASLGIKPVQLISFAQLANGVLLPFVSVWIVWMASRTAVMGKSKSQKSYLILSYLMVLFTLVLGLRSIASVLKWDFL
jgi:NRAMP (natural resistance-associated macrophage protein)-like metal ion transporter